MHLKDYLFRNFARIFPFRQDPQQRACDITFETCNDTEFFYTVLLAGSRFTQQMIHRGFISVGGESPRPEP